MAEDLDVMADTETLGDSPGCVILSLGALCFDRLKPWNIVSGQPEAEHPFKVGISLESCLDLGLRIDARTLRFWMEQDDESRREAFSGTVPLPKALAMFADWFRYKRGRRLWGHGASFDPPILAAAYRACKMEMPWEFRDIRDTRTIFDVAGIQYSGRHHMVLKDCMAQAEKVCEAYGILGKHKGEGILHPVQELAP